MITISTQHDRKPSPTMERVAKDVAKKMDEGLFGSLARKSHKVFLEELAILAKQLKTEVIIKNSGWIFEAKSGEKISMPAGYFLMADGILHEVINDDCHDDMFQEKRKVVVEISR